MIYFIKSPTLNCVKIGVSRNPLQRLKSLQAAVAEPLELLGTHKGSHTAELKLHDKFKHLRVNNEWFKLTDEIARYIAENCEPEMVIEPLKYPMTAEAESSLKAIGLGISVARRRRGWTVTEFAKRAGIDRRTLSDLENGHPGVSTAALVQAMSLLGLLKGLEVLSDPYQDIDALRLEIHKIRSKMNKNKILDSKINF